MRLSILGVAACLFPRGDDVGMDERTLFLSEKRTDTIVILDKPCHSVPQTLACENQPPLESSFAYILGDPLFIARVVIVNVPPVTVAR